MQGKESAVKEAKVVFVTRHNNPVYRKVFWEHVPPGFNVLWMDANESNEDEIVDQMLDADFLLVLGASIPERALREAKQLKLIQLFTQGYDYFPLAITSELGIPVANIGGATAVTVAEHTVLLMLAVLRRIFPSIAALKEGKAFGTLDRRLYHQLYEKVVGIVGFGNIGRRVASLVHGFDAKVIFYDRVEIPPAFTEKVQARPVTLEELLRTADIVSLHVPLEESTRGMIGWEQLEIMKPSAIVINTSRGNIVDEEALIRALSQNKIAGAGLDVFTKEPPESDNPLLDMENVVATPHMGGLAWEHQDARFELIWGNVIDVWHGKPPRNVVNKLSQDGR